MAFSPRYSLLFICDKKKSSIFMANLHNSVCTIVIAGPQNGICNPQGILIMGDHLIVLVDGGKSGLKIIDIKQMLNKSRALLQLEANDEDAQPDEAQASRKTVLLEKCTYTMCLSGLQ